MPVRRTVLKVPRSHGAPVAFEEGAIWFRAQDGSLRNILFGPKLVRIVQE